MHQVLADSAHRSVLARRRSGCKQGPRLAELGESARDRVTPHSCLWWTEAHGEGVVSMVKASCPHNRRISSLAAIDAGFGRYAGPEDAVEVHLKRILPNQRSAWHLSTHRWGEQSALNDRGGTQRGLSASCSKQADEIEHNLDGVNAIVLLAANPKPSMGSSNRLLRHCT
eukprot:5903919-Pleurochrysis_carterae.AAC.6